MRSALVMIDMQRDFLDPQGYFARSGVDVGPVREIVPRAVRLLEAARRAGIRVFHTREGHRPDLSDLTPVKRRRAERAGVPIGSPGPLGRLLVRGERGHAIIDELAPQSGEPVIDKPGYGAFYATDLELLLRTEGVGQLFIAGVTTDICVHSTLREAVDRGFECITVGNACAAGDPQIHAAMLRLIAGEGGILGQVSSTAEVIEGWTR